MGLGDDIMSTAYVEKLLVNFSKARFVMGDGANQMMHWSEVFENNPHMLQPHEEYSGELIFIPDYPGRRAYVDYENSGNGRFTFKSDFAAPVGKIYFSEKELWQMENLKREIGENFIVIEPNVKAEVSSNNKDWGFKNWQDLIGRNRGKVNWLQIGEPGKGRILNHVWKRPTAKFRAALMVLSVSKGFVGTDSALHHAAATLGKPAVVVWGGYSSPMQLGYDGHFNVVPANWQDTSKIGCGTLAPCEHCREAMASITVDVVERAVKEAFT